MNHEKAGGYISRITFNNGESLDISRDDIVIFVGPNNAGKSQSLKDIYTLSKELDQKFPNMEKSLSRLIKFLEILKDHHLITYSEKKSNSSAKTFQK